MKNNNFLKIRAKGITLLLIALAGLLSAGQALAQQLENPRTPYTINPGDLLEISVWKEPDMQRQVLVRPDGAFSFPLSGDILAEGRTVEAIRQELTSQLEAYIPDLVVTVTVAEVRGNKIFVFYQWDCLNKIQIARKICVYTCYGFSIEN